MQAETQQLIHSAIPPSASAENDPAGSSESYGRGDVSGEPQDEDRRKETVESQQEAKHPRAAQE